MIRSSNGDGPNDHGILRCLANGTAAQVQFRTWRSSEAEGESRNALESGRSLRLSAFGSGYFRPRILADLAEVIVEGLGESGAVFLPMGGGRIIIEAGDPIAVELVDGGVDAETCEPTFTERAGVLEGRFRMAFGKPCVASKKRLEDFHSLKVTIELRAGRAADMESAIAVVVKFQRELGPLPACDHGLQP